MKRSTALSAITIIIILVITYPPQQHLANKLVPIPAKIQLIDAVDRMAMKVLEANNLIIKKSVEQKIKFDDAQINRINKLENRIEKIINMPIIVVQDTTYIKKKYILPKGLIKVPIDTLILK